jgi:hypothetical protein
MVPIATTAATRVWGVSARHQRSATIRSRAPSKQTHPPFRMNATPAVDRPRRIAAQLVVGIALCGGAAAQSIPGYPGSIFAFDPREVALLPRFCTYTQHFREQVPGGNNMTLVRSWEAQLGPTFQHLHHYCYGLMKTNRGVLLARSAQARQAYLVDAVGEFDYVIERAPPDFVLLPEVLTKKGENLMRLGKAPVAVYNFERAIEVRPDYWPAYAQLADYHKSVGDTKQAREALEKGLAQAPDASALKRRLDDLDDKR